MTASHCRPGRLAQRGQAIVWFLATIAACCCVLALVYNVGQMANKKEETVNAADAAALSGAMIEARMLNFQAYANRAKVANEVTVAQLVSTDSFLQYGATLSQNLADYISAIPIVGEFAGPVLQGIAEGLQAAQLGFQAAVPALVQGLGFVQKALSLATDAAYVSGANSANSVASNIAAANSTTFGGRTDATPQLVADNLAQLANQGKWFAFRDNSDDRTVASQIIQDSRDQFAVQRDNSDAINIFNDSLEAAMLVASGGSDYIQFVKTSGQTKLKDFDHWAAQDSMDIQDNSCTFGLFCSSNFIPFIDMGYGRTDADANGGGQSDNLCYPGDTMILVGGPTWNCKNATDNGDSISGWAGIPVIHDIAKGLSNRDPCTTNNGSDSPSLQFVMAVRKAGSSTLSTQTLGMNAAVPGPQGSPQMTDNLQNGNSLTAMSAACVFFLRPDGKNPDPTRGALARQDGKHEFASFYNPYWQARLTAPESTWISAVYGAIGQAGLIPWATQ
ncbi:MAG TPA: pilus assembly protein TadG-related protein [Steroidobacteraceae bacterium]|nr:pilus assembly protein TadG-related protein [Steroidobacteraceae bacterium]